MTSACPTDRTILGLSFPRDHMATATAWCLGAASLTLMLCLFAGAKLLNDPDAQWHVASGLWMIEKRTFPRTDFMSFTFFGQPWIAKEWLSQIFLAAAYLAGAWEAVVTLASLAVAATFYGIARHVSARTDVPGGLIMASFAFIVVSPTLLARPHVLVFPIIVAWTLAFIRSAETTRRPPWHMLPLLVLWTNMHASFMMGCAIAATFGLEALVNTKPAERLATVLRWLAFGLACLAAVTITPYGIEPLLISKNMATDNEATAFIAEWRSADLSFHWAGVVIVIAASLYALSRDLWANAARMLLVTLLTYAMLRHQRVAMFAGLVIPIIAGPALWNLAKGLFERLDIFQTKLLPTKEGIAQYAACALAALAIAVAAIKPVSLPTRFAPTEAMAHVPDDLRSKRVFNSYNLGGYLIFVGIKTFIDGRNDQIYLGGYTKRVLEATKAPAPDALVELLNEYAVEWAFIAAESSEARLFPNMPGWHLLHKDGAAQVYARN